eukprot:COSAG02_NODE_132_length_34701_cov_707.955234_14_plen_318_part_00
MAFSAQRHVALQLLIGGLVVPSPTTAPMTCSGISINCMCEWSTSSAWKQVAGLAKAPDEAQDDAEACERWCCTMNAGWHDGLPSQGGKAGVGRCQVWQYMPPDPTGKLNLGCWAGIQVVGDGATYGQVKAAHSSEWIGASGCLGIGTDWGTPFLIVLFLGTTAYLGGGALYNKKQGARGKDLLPHRAKWQNIYALVLDGLAFARGGGKVRRRPVVATKPLLATDGGEQRKESKERESGRSSGKREKERERGKKKEKGSGRKENKSKRSSDVEAGRELGVGVSPPTQVAAERELQEQREHDPKLHESQARIKVVGING